MTSVPGRINKIVVKVAITIIARYSAIKIIANFEALYSVLNPETSSDSPSAISNGVRFVSARQVITQASIMGRINNMRGKPLSRSWEKLNVFRGSSAATKIRAILIS